MILRRVAGEAGAVLCALDDFGDRHHVLPDAVHPTSVGELAIAAAAARALGAPTPSADPPRGRLRFELWWALLWLRDVVRRVRERRAYDGP